MSRILLIDRDDKCRAELGQALSALNAANKLEAFTGFIEFESYCQSLPDEETIEFLKFDLVIFDYGLVEPADWKEKINYFRLEVTGNTTYAYTAYDTPGVNRKFILSLQAQNIFYKPFDHLILKESLNLALNAKKDTKPKEIQPRKDGGIVGILKEIELVSICELGFVTMSDVQIPSHGMSKYFSSLFSRGKRQSIFAECLLSIQIPKRPDRFINKFHYIGLEHDGLTLIRRYLQSNKSNRTSGDVWDLKEPKGHTSILIGIIDTSEHDFGSFKEEIERHFKNVKVDFVRIEPAKNPDAKYEKFDAIINQRTELKIEELKKFFRADIPYFLMLDSHISEEALKELQPHYRDIFTTPNDRGYFYKKLKLFLHDAELHEPFELINASSAEKMKAANFVNLSEICELYLKFQYHRPLEYGDFREFAFVNEDENQIIELPAYCNHVTKEKNTEGKDVYSHQFIFWGMTDYYLKEIRLWLLRNYVNKTKEK